MIWAPVLLFSMVAHDFVHAAAVYRQGDDTADMRGRLTMNPLKHIDPFMTVLLRWPAVKLMQCGAGLVRGFALPGVSL